MALIGRMFVTGFALLLASLAVAVVLAIGITWPLWRDFFFPGTEPAVFSAVAGVGMFVVFGVALLPAAVVVALAEAFRWRSALFYAAAGAVGMPALFYGAGSFDLVSSTAVSREWEIVAASGIAGGLIYWALAGRNAGLWCERAPA